MISLFATPSSRSAAELLSMIVPRVSTTSTPSDVVCMKTFSRDFAGAAAVRCSSVRSTRFPTQST
jgi:hypothetical protein